MSILATTAAKKWQFVKLGFHFTLSGAVIVLSVMLFIYPAVIVCILALDSELKQTGQSRLVPMWFNAAAGRYASWADTYIETKFAETLYHDDVAATEWPMFGSVFVLVTAEDLQRQGKIDATRGNVRDAVEKAAQIVASPVTATWVKTKWGDGYLEKENVFYRMLLIMGLSSLTPARRAVILAGISPALQFCLRSHAMRFACWSLALGVLAVGLSPAARAAEPAQKSSDKKPAAAADRFKFSSPAELVSQRSDGVLRIPLLPPSAENARNSEGDFLQLSDGRVMFVYSRFTGGGDDHAAADLAARFSSDGGRTWTDRDTIVVPNEGGCNVMSVSLLRLRGGPIALFYLRKNAMTDCRPCMRTSTDEGRTWSPPKVCVEDRVGYYVLNNDRAVQLGSGRILLPLALHCTPEEPKFQSSATIVCYLSDDQGATWRRSTSELKGQSPEGKPVVCQEPGLIELKDGRVMLYCRTKSGCQYVSYSSDGGQTWSPLGPSNILSPCSPAVIKRIPTTSDLLLVWNDHQNVPAELKNKRTPFNAAISRDEGKTWERTKTLEDDPAGWYCYPAVEIIGPNVLVGHCSGDTRLVPHLAFTQITRFSLDWLYK